MLPAPFAVRLCDRFECGVGWIVEEFIGRCSHALAVDGGVWLVDPVDHPDAEAAWSELGEPRGVIQLLDRHTRDAEELAGGLRVPWHRVPFGGVAEAPFQFLPVARSRFWAEVALWWPEGRTLVVADALGTLPYFRAPGEELGVSPWLRTRPPRQLAALDPSHVLCGHGEGIHGERTADLLRAAFRGTGRRAPAAFARGLVDLGLRGLGGRVRGVPFRA